MEVEEKEYIHSSERIRKKGTCLHLLFSIDATVHLVTTTCNLQRFAAAHTYRIYEKLFMEYLFMITYLLHTCANTTFWVLPLSLVHFAE